MKLEGSAERADDQVAAEIAMFGRVDYGQIAESRFLAGGFVWHFKPVEAGAAGEAVKLGSYCGLVLARRLAGSESIGTLPEGTLDAGVRTGSNVT